MKKEIARGKFLRLVNYGDGWESAERIISPKAVVIIPITNNNEIILVEQFRHPINGRSIELPAGLIGDTRVGESSLNAAKAELLEETGYVAENWQLIMKDAVVSPGFTNETIDIYLATDLRKVFDGPTDPDEKITMHEININQIFTWMNEMKSKNIVLDAKLYIGIHFAKEILAEKESELQLCD